VWSVDDNQGMKRRGRNEKVNMTCRGTQNSHPRAAAPVRLHSIRNSSRLFADVDLELCRKMAEGSDIGRVIVGYCQKTAALPSIAGTKATLLSLETRTHENAGKPFFCATTTDIWDQFGRK
jgi:hypothetical protein